MKGGNVRLRKEMKLPDASDGVVELPDDLIYLIFLKLPNKSLVRFLILSKQWKEAITSRKFFMHQKKTNPERLVTNIFVHKISKRDRLYAQRIWGNHCQYRRVLEVSIPVHYLWLSASTRDGLIGIVHAKDTDNPDIHSFVIWNPYTGQKKEVSLPRGYGYRYESIYCSVEFGFDATIHDYKIILIFRDFSRSSEYVNKIMIRALRSEQWRTVYCASSDSSSIRLIEMYDVVVIDGDVWWIAKISTIDDECHKSHVLIKLSLAEEKLSTVALLPGEDIDSDKYWKKFHLRHHDELIYFIDSQLDSEYRIWRFIKQTEAWELAYVVQNRSQRTFYSQQSGLLVMELSL